MDVFETILSVIDNVESFSNLVNELLIDQLYWHNNQQITILDYLILNHQPILPEEEAALDIPLTDLCQEIERPSSEVFGINLNKQDIILPKSEKLSLAHHDYSKQIMLLLSRGANPNYNHSLHLALKLKKYDLFELIVKFITDEDKADRDGACNELAIDERDKEGYTLLARAIENGEYALPILRELLDYKADVNLDTIYQNLACQPLHQAILCDNRKAIKLLIESNASLTNPCGQKAYTLIQLAINTHKMLALEELLEHEQILQHLQNSDKQSINHLCVDLNDRTHKLAALRGIALMLCSGSAVPSTEELRKKVRKFSLELLSHVGSYATTKPELIKNFLNIIHDRNNAWHKIFFPLPKNELDAIEKMALTVERENILTVEHLKYAIFVIAYTAEAKKDAKRFDHLGIINRNHMFAELQKGQITNFASVELYVQDDENKHSRSTAVYNALWGEKGLFNNIDINELTTFNQLTQAVSPDLGAEASNYMGILVKRSLFSPVKPSQIWNDHFIENLPHSFVK